MKLNNLSLLKKEVETMMNEAKASLYEEIKNTKLEGVKVVDDQGGVLISFSALKRDVSISYYIPERQASVVMESLKNANTIPQIVEEVSKMLNEKTVIVNGQKEDLNAETLKVLKKFLENT